MTKNIHKIDNKINVFINNHPEWGGTYQYTSLIIKAIESKFNKSSINFYYTNKHWSKKFKKKANFINLNLQSLILAHILIFFESKKLAKLFSKILLPSFPKSFFDKDQIWIFPSQDILSVICNGKTIVWINDLMHRYSDFKETSSFFRKIYRDYLFKKIARRSFRVLVDSKLGKNHVQESYGIFNNIRVQYFSAFKIKLKKTGNPNVFGKYLIYPAQSWEHKNHLRLIKAFHLISQDDKDLYLLLTGSKTKYYENIQKLINRYSLKKKIFHLGRVNNTELINLYLNAQLLIVPSLFESISIPIYEAFRLGIPVCCADSGSMKWQVKEAAVVFNPYNLDEMIYSIKKVLYGEKLKLKLVKNGEKIINNNSLDLYTKSLEKTFRNFI